MLFHNQPHARPTDPHLVDGAAAGLADPARCAQPRERHADAQVLQRIARDVAHGFQAVHGGTAFGSRLQVGPVRLCPSRVPVSWRPTALGSVGGQVCRTIVD